MCLRIQLPGVQDRKASRVIIKLIRLAKNISKKAYELGHALHKRCTCAPVLTKDLQERKDGRRAHRGVNTASHPLVKVIQRGDSATLTMY